MSFYGDTGIFTLGTDQEFVVGLDKYGVPAVFRDRVHRYTYAVVDFITHDKVWFTYNIKKGDWIFTSFAHYAPCVIVDAKDVGNNLLRK